MFVRQKKLPTAKTVKRLVPLTSKQIAIKKVLDEQLATNFSTREKLVVVCGPCSADNPNAVKEYLQKLAAIKNQHPDLLVVARVYTTKPHTDGTGYHGLAFGDNGVSMDGGIVAARQLMRDALDLGLPVADELLYPELYRYFDDVVSYWFLGARSSEDELHRAFASSLDVCVGVKNSTDGYVPRAVASLYAVSHPAVFPFDGVQFSTSGAKYAHLVLRGGDNGEYFSNISEQSVSEAKQLLQSRGLNDFIIADLGHANSGKIADNQLQNARMVAVNPDVNGVIVESYLFHGKANNKYGYSKTDECIGLEETAELFNILSEGFALRKKSQDSDDVIEIEVKE